MEKHGILVYLECVDGKATKVALEAVSAAQRLSKLTNAPICFVTIGNSNDLNVVEHCGAEELIKVNVREYQPEVYAATLYKIYNLCKPDYLLAGGTREGKELAARIAAYEGISYISDVISFKQERERLGVVRNIYSGSLQETLMSAVPVIMTIRTGSFGKPDVLAVGTISTRMDAPSIVAQTTIRNIVQTVEETVNLEEADIIVAGGRGMGNAENFGLVQQLAQILGGVVGASRPAIDAGWISQDHQVGQSGKIVAPKLYIACGISGAIQHVSGILGSDFIVAINKDETAPIFDSADLAVVGDAVEIIPLFIQEIQTRRN